MTLEQTLNEFELLINDNDYAFELEKNTISRYESIKRFWFLDIDDNNGENIFSDSSLNLQELLISGIKKIKEWSNEI